MKDLLHAEDAGLLGLELCVAVLDGRGDESGEGLVERWQLELGRLEEVRAIDVRSGALGVLLRSAVPIFVEDGEYPFGEGRS